MEVTFNTELGLFQIYWWVATIWSFWWIWRIVQQPVRFGDVLFTTVLAYFGWALWPLYLWLFRKRIPRMFKFDGFLGDS